jgi:hypothetical protein
MMHWPSREMAVRVHWEVTAIGGTDQVMDRGLPMLTVLLCLRSPLGGNCPQKNAISPSLNIAQTISVRQSLSRYRGSLEELIKVQANRVAELENMIGFLRTMLMNEPLMPPRQ